MKINDSNRLIDNTSIKYYLCKETSIPIIKKGNIIG